MLKDHNEACAEPTLERCAPPAPPQDLGRGAAVARETFPKACRILHRAEFLRLQGRGQRIHTAHLIFQFLPGRTPRTRLGLTVSKKVGNAVVRNQIKRWLRESFRRHPELRPDRSATDPTQRPYDLVITAKRDVTGFSFAVLHAELVEVLGHYLNAPRDERRPSPRRAPPPRPSRA